MDEQVLRVRLAPDAAVTRLKSAMNRPPKRTFGVKTSPEYVGVASGREFEVWERRNHAVHLVGRVAGVRGGSSVTLWSTLTWRSRVLAVMFVAIFVVAAWGFGTLPGGEIPPAVSALVGVAGAVACAVYFWWSARQQRAALVAFVRQVFADALDER